jgi:hypothetical protein
MSGNDILDVVSVKHLGVKNVDLEYLLMNENGSEREGRITSELFTGSAKKPADYEDVCAKQCPLLYRKIVCIANRNIIRFKSIE